MNTVCRAVREERAERRRRKIRGVDDAVGVSAHWTTPNCTARIISIAVDVGVATAPALRAGLPVRISADETYRVTSDIVMGNDSRLTLHYAIIQLMLLQIVLGRSRRSDV